MRFPPITHPLTGLAVPVGALRTAQSCGIGEFADLPVLAEFCKKAGFDLVQLLPVNDTGTESSPYSALSAFALHPLYIRLSDLPEAAGFEKQIANLKSRFEDLPRFGYTELRRAKLDILRAVFDKNKATIIGSAELEAWIAENPWIIEYAVFMNQKHRNFEAGWKHWEKLRNPTHNEIQKTWQGKTWQADHQFFAWMQMRLDQQFTAAATACNALGVYLKGDIPIMMNEDSADAWANPEFFRDDLRAGSPPDGGNPQGQNWGFPIYNWENLANDGYSWWKKRLKHSARYYHAYRIDHILGFFRIWAIPYGEYSGYLGWPLPHEPVSAAELAERGFSKDRLRWLTEPHLPTRAAEEANNWDYLGTHGYLNQVMNRIGEEELWLFKPEITCEADIRNTNLPDALKEVLVRQWKNRLLQVTGRDEKGRTIYYPLWRFRDSTAWQTLTDGEKHSLEELFAKKAAHNETLWREQAVELLGELTRSTDMLACAEDLGSIPHSVPEVLSNLSIYSLRVTRWARQWDAPGQPFHKLDEYPVMSVATPSVHDSSTLRGWWETEGGDRAFMDAWPPEQDGYAGAGRHEFEGAWGPRQASWVLRKLCEARSALCVFPIQDILALSPDFYAMTADEERINIPGSVSGFNWTYRLPVAIENLSKNSQLITAIQTALQDRRARKVQGAHQ